jgi:DNA-binding MarR family transcriptional regulator
MRRQTSATLEELGRDIFELTKFTWLATRRTRHETQYDLSETEFLVLDALEQRQCLTVGELQRRIRVLPAQMSRIVKSLETRHERPLIACAINAHDKRKVDVRLTRVGRKAAEAFRRRKIGMAAAALDRLSQSDLESLDRIVRLIRKAMDSMASA